MSPVQRLAGVLAAVAILACGGAAEAQQPEDFPYDGMVRIDTAYDFPTLWSRLETAVRDHEMLLLMRASASRGAANRGINIPSNGVMDVFRNDYAVRMLEASVAAGFEAPMRFYLVEAENGGTALIYRRPSAAFAAYGADGLDEVGAELDVMFASIAAQATAAAR
ncbi:MAG: DUF302 domain-containing protein [Rhodospirillaceae bacterium]|nr:DUF302 domain-containing protein [Rhodospirillaceae bacterium]